jgi:hypothetical protein
MICTWTGPYIVLTAAPVTVLTPAVLPPAVLPPAVLPPEAGADAAPVAPPLGVLIAAGGALPLAPLMLCVLNVSSRTRPTTVLTTARITRRMPAALPSKLNPQNSNN